ncbi:MAG TPA: YfbR-like 5'-deoxynucleotidase [Candidatus Saccharimonadia bacterium]|nr:YfbR-like 5'-deoxynucleotidase [Candidatus Saccharimonadia bacterium]
MKFDPETLDPRRALQVTRYHTWPRLREQSVGEHTAQVMRIMLAIYPSASVKLLTYALFHDIGEVAVGDVPYPAKNQDATIQAAFDAAELQAHIGMVERFVLPAPIDISPLEKLIFKLAEYIEMWEWGLHETNLGNRYAVLVSKRMYDAIHDKLYELKQLEQKETAQSTAYYLHARRSYEKDITEKV